MNYDTALTRFHPVLRDETACNWSRIADGGDYDDALTYMCFTHGSGPYFYGRPEACGLTQVVVDGWEGQCTHCYKSEYRVLRCSLDAFLSHSDHWAFNASGEVQARWGSEHSNQAKTV